MKAQPSFWIGLVLLVGGALLFRTTLWALIPFWIGVVILLVWVRP